MNSLKNASSPYLLQHANNPVDWYPWGAEALSKAQRENKLIVVSIGYSACHWCHVMEHESFEDLEVAEVMNALYVNIKVDREERPDIDQIYMSALQLMNGSGGWPLNCILLPDQRPIYGGTYFRKSDWVNILSNIAKLFRTKPEELYAYADKLMTGVHQMERIMESNQNQGFSEEQLHELINKWQKYLDFDYGGTQGAPKFPVPINLQCLLRYETVFPNQHLDFYLQNTLYRIARGGIYDQLAGGIYRYSVDGEWKIPHFEKMLYDQAQSLALFAEAYRKYKNPLYLEVIDSTIHFLENELKNQLEGGYYAALDADSEGQEGKYYCWSTAEMRAMIPHADLLIEYYQLTKEGNFEHGLNNLIPLVDESDFLEKHQLSTIDWQNILSEAKLNLVKLRSQRVRPGLDDKQLCAWNALLVQGFVEAYQASSNEKYKQLAIDLIEFIETHLMEGSMLFRNYKDGQKSIPAFCDDYAFLLQAYLSVFQISADEHYLRQAEELLRHLIDHFYDQNSGLFWYTSNQAEELITRKQEYYDSVIPSSNSVLMHALNQLSRINGDPSLEQISQKMFGALQELMLKYPPSFGNWIYYGLKMVCPPTELIITGLDAAEEYKSLMNKHIPTTLLLFSEKSLERGCFKNRVVAGKTLFYFCKDHACQLPLNSSNGILGRENLYE